MNVHVCVVVVELRERGVIFVIFSLRERRREDRSTLNFLNSIFFPSSLSLVFSFPFPILFGGQNFFFLFLPLLVSAFLGLNMSETRLNLLFLMVLLPRLEVDCWSIDTAVYFDCIFLHFFNFFFRFRFLFFLPLF